MFSTENIFHIIKTLRAMQRTQQACVIIYLEYLAGDANQAKQHSNCQQHNKLNEQASSNKLIKLSRTTL